MPDDPRVTITGAGAGPIVVCGATGDPATPLNSTRGMASALEDGRLVVIVSDGHICYGATECADDIIDDYLVNLDVPPHETDCAPSSRDRRHVGRRRELTAPPIR